MTKTARLVFVSIAAVLVVAAVMYLLTRTPQTEAISNTADESQTADEALEAAPALETESSRETTRRDVAVANPSDGVDPRERTQVLRVLLEGIDDESARMAKVTVNAFDTASHRTSQAEYSWACQGLASEFDLSPFFAAMAEQEKEMSFDEIKIDVNHPQFFHNTTHVPISDGVEGRDGQIVYEVDVEFDDIYWPEFQLAVRDKHTREHLEDVELRFVSTRYMGLWQQPGSTSPYTVLGTGLNSPIPLRGGRRKDGPEDRAAGIALRPAVGEAPQPAALDYPTENERGIMMYARAPGYAWGKIVLDVSKGAKRELMLEPGASLGVQFANLQLEAYATLEKPATLCVGRIGPDGGVSGVYFHRIDEAVATEGVRIENLLPGEHSVSVELGHAFTWRKRHVLGREKIELVAGKQHEVLLILADSPGPPELAILGGELSFPAFGGEDDVRLCLYKADYKYGEPDFEFSLADMVSAEGALPTWSFRFEDLPVGRYQARLAPFEKNWMIELPSGGRDDLELVISELAEVFVETVDVRTGERIPLEQIRYNPLEDLPDRIHQEWSSQRNMARFEGEPGRFRFWTVPGPAQVSTYSIPEELGLYGRRMELELVAGLQSVRLELGPSCSLLLEFRIDGGALPREDPIFHGIASHVRPVGNDALVGYMTYCLLIADAPGLYDIDFEGVGSDRFLPIPSRQVELRDNELTKVVIELQRK